MRKTILLITLLAFTLNFSGCFRSKPEDKIKEKLESLATDLSFKTNVTPIQMVVKTKSLIEKYFHASVKINLKVRESNFNIPNAKILAQNFFLLNKMAGNLSLEFDDIKITALGDDQGIYYKAEFEIDAIGKNAQDRKEIDEEIPYIFYFREFNKEFLIFKGENPNEDNELE